MVSGLIHCRRSKIWIAGSPTALFIKLFKNQTNSQAVDPTLNYARERETGYLVPLKNPHLLAKQSNGSPNTLNRM